MNVFTAPGEITAPRFAAAFARGCGGIVRSHYTGGPWAGFGSPQTWEGLQKAIAAGEQWYYGDHAYFARRQYYRITANAYQHSGVGRGDPRRLARFHSSAAPWKRNGGHIIVCAQTQNHYDRHGVPTWIEDTIAQLRSVTDRPIMLRTKKTEPDLQHNLRGAWCVVVQSSNAAVDAIMQGVPAFCTHPCVASVMSKSDLADIERPYYPDGRMEWASVLAANQWTLEEIASGMAWRNLQDGLR